MHSNVWPEKFYADQHLTRIIRINKSHAEICRFRMLTNIIIINWIVVSAMYYTYLMGR